MKDKSQPHYFGHRERLKNRFLKNSINGLQDYEAIELLLTYSISQKDTKTVAKALLQRFKNISGVLSAEVHELEEIKGIGKNSAILINLTRSLLELYMKEKAFSGRKLSSPHAVIDYCRISVGRLKDEQFRAIFLNTQNELLAEEIIQEGTVDQAVVYPRRVLEKALKHRASGIIFVHNHPGGGLKPSENDVELTRRLKDTLKEMGIKIHDHFIITKEGYYSFHENKLL